MRNQVSNLSELANLGRIKRIFLKGTRVDSLNEFFSLPKLEELLLLRPAMVRARRLPVECNAKFIYIHGLKTLESLEELVGYSKLQTLIIRDCHLPPSGFEMLRHITSLKRVFIEYASKRNREQIASLLPPRVSMLRGPLFSVDELRNQQAVT